MSFELRLKGMPLFYHRSRSVYAYPVILIALMLASYLGLMTFDKYQGQQRLEKQNQYMTAALAKQNEIARALKARVQANKYKDDASLSIISMLNPVAQLLSPDIAIVSLDANPDKKVITLEVNTTSLAALLDFSARLEQIPAEVELRNHTPTKQANDKWAVNSTLMINFPD